MDDTPLHRAIPASFLCGRCLCVVYSENTATPSRACSENLAHGDTRDPESANTLMIYQLGSGLGPEAANRLIGEFKAKEKQEMQDCA